MAACLRIKQQIKKSYWRAQRDVISQIYHSGYKTKTKDIKTNIKISDMVKHDRLLFTKVYKKELENKSTNEKIEETKLRKVLQLVGQSF